ncbi:hypothetical protein AB0A71_39155 [Kitasatospora aureofaciens]|uniref:DIP1984 family protein n=1 Tax=Kitasatospora aureofaciens TaxID=1894 RepID=UPI0033DEA0D4
MVCCGGCGPWRRGVISRSGTELRILSALAVAELRAGADALAKDIREVDTLIQRTNWEIEFDFPPTLQLSIAYR